MILLRLITYWQIASNFLTKFKTLDYAYKGAPLVWGTLETNQKAFLSGDYAYRGAPLIAYIKE